MKTKKTIAPFKTPHVILKLDGFAFVVNNDNSETEIGIFNSETEIKSLVHNLSVQNISVYAECEDNELELHKAHLTLNKNDQIEYTFK